MLYLHKRRRLLSSFTFIKSKYKWYIGTYHVYKRGKQITLLNKLSYITDKLRKYYPSDTIIYITKETTQDNYPHYHFLIGLVPDDWGCHISICNIRNAKLWYRNWNEKDNLFTYKFIEDNRDNGLIPMYKFYGCKQRWFKYGIYKYLLYMFKYSNYSRFNDYYIQFKNKSFCI